MQSDSNYKKSQIPLTQVIESSLQEFYHLLNTWMVAWQDKGVDESKIHELISIIHNETNPFIRAQVASFLGHMLSDMPSPLRHEIATMLIQLTNDQESIVQRVGFDACSNLIKETDLRYLAVHQLRKLPPPENEFIADRQLAAQRRALEVFSDDSTIKSLLEKASRSSNSHISGLAHFHLALSQIFHLIDPISHPTQQQVGDILTRLRFATQRADSDPRLQFLEAVLSLLNAAIHNRNATTIYIQEHLLKARIALTSILQNTFYTWNNTRQEASELWRLLYNIQRLFDLITDLDTLIGSPLFGPDFVAALDLSSSILDGAEKAMLLEAPGGGELAYSGRAISVAVRQFILPRHASQLHEANPQAGIMIRRYLDRTGHTDLPSKELIKIFTDVRDPLEARSEAKLRLLARIDSLKDPNLMNLRTYVESLKPETMTFGDELQIQQEILDRSQNLFATSTKTYIGGDPNTEQRIRELMLELDLAAPSYPKERRELFEHVLAILIRYLRKSWLNPRWFHLRDQDEIYEPILGTNLKGLGESVPEIIFQSDLFDYLQGSTDIGHFITAEDNIAGSRIDFVARFPSVHYPIEVKVTKTSPLPSLVRSHYLSQAQGYTVAFDQIGFQLILDVSPKPKNTIEPNLMECIWWDSATSEQAVKKGGVAVLVCYGNRWKRQSDRSTYG